jgi:hypothetical protein
MRSNNMERICFVYDALEFFYIYCQKFTKLLIFCLKLTELSPIGESLQNFRQCISALSPIGESQVYFRQCIYVFSPIGESLVYFRQYVLGLSPIIGESLIGEERISHLYLIRYSISS